MYIEITIGKLPHLPHPLAPPMEWSASKRDCPFAGTRRSRIAPDYREVMRKLRGVVISPALPTPWFPQIWTQTSDARLTLSVTPSYSPAHESPQMDDNVCWMLRRAGMRSR